MKDYITGLFGLAIAVFLYFASEAVVAAGGGLAKNPAFYPRALALLLAVLAVCLIINALLHREKAGVSLDKELFKNVVQVFLLILLYIVIFQYVGFIVSTAAFIFCGILPYGGTVKGALLCSVPVTVVVYVVFHIIMQVAMPVGILI